MVFCCLLLADDDDAVFCSRVKLLPISWKDTHTLPTHPEDRKFILCTQLQSKAAAKHTYTMVDLSW